MPVDFRTLNATLQLRGARWQSQESTLTAVTPLVRRRRLGFHPGPNELSLKNREDLAKAHHQGAAIAGAALAGAPPIFPPSYDLRDINGQSFITSIKDQGQCGSCVAFGSIAAIEGTYQVATSDPSISIDLSEAQLFYCYGGDAGRVCGYHEEPNAGWWPSAALDAAKNGVGTDTSFPYTDQDQTCAGLSSDWKQGAMAITGWHALNSVTDMKVWLATRGPLVTTMSVYDDFYGYKSGVYHYVTGSLIGGHCVCVVGYDEAQKCWICKNSWKADWGLAGFFCIGYSECGIDATMYAVEGVKSL